MAQDPLKPKDNGKVRLPKVDGAMNKLPPVSKKGGKGAKDDKGTISDDKPDDSKLLARARKRMDQCIEAESSNRKDELEDVKFKSGDQWPSKIRADRDAQKRPCLTINKMPTFIKQVTNDLRQNRPSINVSPVGDRGDKEVAKFYRGLIRAIERDSAADIAYDTGIDWAATSGVGYCRLTTEYEKPDSFDQVICIKRVRNRFTVYLDPNHQEPDGCDAMFGFVTEMIPRSEFTETYPEAQEVPFDQRGTGEAFKNWAEKDAIRVAEYYEVETDTRTLVALANGHVGWEDELDDSTKALVDSGTMKVENRREAQTRKVMWYKLTALEVLEREETVWNWVPLPKFIGDEIDVEGKVIYKGVVRDAKDPQRMYNYWRTLQTEKVALAPKAKFLAEEGQIEGHEAEWKNANTSISPVLTYKGTSLGGHPVPPPGRIAPEPLDAGVEGALQGAAQDMMATTGIRFDATMHERLHDESGKALRELRERGDITNFHFADNAARTLRHIGRVLIDAIPKVYDRKRMLTILREDDSEEQVQIDPKQQKPQSEGTHPETRKKLKIFNPTYGQYGVTVTIGPSYATKRIEASESMMAFAKALPNTAVMIADLIAKNQDWPGSEEMAARLAKVIASQHPGIMTPDMKDVTPQIQAALVSMDQQIKALHTQLAAAAKALADKGADRQVAIDKINKDFEAKILAVLQKIEAAQQKEGTAQVEKLAESVQLLGNLLNPPKKEEKPDHMPALIESTNKLHERFEGMVKQMTKPRKARLKRADGSVLEIETVGDEEK